MTNLASYFSLSPFFPNPKPLLSDSHLPAHGGARVSEEEGAEEGEEMPILGLWSFEGGGDNTLLAGQSRKGLLAAAGRTTFHGLPPPARLIRKSKPSEEAARKQETFSTKQTDLIRAGRVALN